MITFSLKQPLKSHKIIILVNLLLRKALCLKPITTTTTLCPTNLFRFICKQTSRQAIGICEISKLKLLNLLQFISLPCPNLQFMEERERKRRGKQFIFQKALSPHCSMENSSSSTTKNHYYLWHYTTVLDDCTTSTQLSQSISHFL